MPEHNNWSAYEKLVLSKLDENAARMGRLEDSVILVRIDVAKLKVKAGIWGAVAGMIPSLLVLAVTIVRLKMG